MGKLNFKVFIGLNADKFRKGAKQVEHSISGLRNEVYSLAGMLGLGALSLGGLLSKMIQVSREAGATRTALRNVSSTYGDFARNMSYLRQVSQEFGQSLTTTTSSFAKFTAAATQAGLQMEQQRKIFTSITKAISAFQLGGEEAKLTFYAISQMMAKGKISAEELRRQLGERMPIAIEAMARAAGVTTKELDNLLKAGALNSKELLPKFAQELEKMLPNVSTDNLEASISRLGNAFLGVTDRMGIYDKFKKLVDGLSYLLGKFADGSISIMGTLMAALATTFARPIGRGVYNNLAKSREEVIRSVYRQEEALAKKHEHNLETIRGARRRVQTANDDRLAAQAKLKEIEAQQQKKIEDLRAKREVEANRQNTNERHLANVKELQDIEQKGIPKLQRHENAIANLAKRQQELAKATQERLAYEAKAEHVTARLARNEEELAKAKARSEALVASRNESKVARKFERNYAKLLTNEQRLESKIAPDRKFVTDYEKNHGKLVRAQERHQEYLATARLKLAKEESLYQEKLADKKLELSEKIAKAEQAHQQSVVKAVKDIDNSILRTKGNTTKRLEAQSLKLANKQIAYEQEVARASQKIADGKLSKQALAGAKAEAMAMRLRSRLSKGFTTLAHSLKGVFSMVGQALSSMAFSAVIAGITYAITKLVEYYQEAKRVANMVSEFNKELERAGSGAGNEEIVRLQSLQRLLQETIDKKQRSLKLEQDIAKTLGVDQVNSQEELNKLIEKRIGLLKKQAKIEFLQRRIAQADERIEELNQPRIDSGKRPIDEAMYEQYLQQEEELNKIAKDNSRFRIRKGELTDFERMGLLYAGRLGDEASVREEYRKRHNGQAPIITELEEFEEWKEQKKLLEIKRQAQAEQDRLEAERITATTPIAPTTPTTPELTDQQKRIQKVQEEYYERMRQLNNQLKAKTISQGDYESEKHKAATKAVEDLSAELGASARYNRTFREALANAPAGFVALTKAQEETEQAIRKYEQQLKHGHITQEQYDGLVASVAKKEAELLASQSELSKTQQERLGAMHTLASQDSEAVRQYNAYLREVDYLTKNKDKLYSSEQEYQEALRVLTAQYLRQANKMRTTTSQEQTKLEEVQNKLSEAQKQQGLPKLEARDTTFDYQLSKSEVYRKQADHLRQYSQKLSELRDVSQEAREQIAQLKGEIESLDQASKLARLEEDIERLNAQLNQGLYSGMKNVASSVKAINDSFQSLAQTLESDTATAFDKLFATFNAFTQVVDALLSVKQMIEALTQTTQMLTAVQEAQATVNAGAKATEVAQVTTASATIVAANTAEQISNEALAESNAALAASRIMAAHAHIPFVGVATGTSMVAAMKATLASARFIKGYANGGIIPGGFGGGDRVLARVNPGELILNRAQQGNIAQQLQSSAQAQRIQVEVTGNIRGKDIILSSARTQRLSDR